MNTRNTTPNIFKTATATASGDTVVWTPSAGKRFRLMMYSIQITADAATSGGADIDIVLRDGTTPIGIGFSTFVPAVAATTIGGYNGTEWVDIGSGYVSKVNAQALNVNLSAALTAGKVRVNVCGVEE